MGIQVISDSATVSKVDCYNQIMFEIQKRMVDIDLNRDQRKSIHNEVADMVHLANKLCEIENVDASIIEKRKAKVDKALEE